MPIKKWRELTPEILFEFERLALLHLSTSDDILELVEEIKFLNLKIEKLEEIVSHISPTPIEFIK